MLQYLVRDFKESDGAIIDANDPEVFKARLVQISTTPVIISGVSGPPIFTSSTTIAPSLSPMFCSLLSIVMGFTLLTMRRTLHLRSQLASTFVISLQQSI